MISDWQSSIASADLADWVTVTAYLLASLMSARASAHAWLKREKHESIFWRTTAVVMVFLGMNELLDLQTLLTSIGREHAISNGWYAEHRKVQLVFLLLLALGAAFTGVVLLWFTRRAHVAVRLALAGLFLIGLFILVRAASFHHADEILGRGFKVFTWGSLQELAGIFVVAGAAAFYTRKPRKMNS